MVSSDDEDNNLNNSNYTLPSPSSSTSSFASSPLTSPASILTLSGPTQFITREPINSSTTSQKTMEEVWEDINLSSLHNHSTPTFRGVILQDFFARPFSKSPSTSIPSERYGSPPPPATRPVSLNLNTHPNNNIPFLGLVSSDDPNNREPRICNVGLHRMPLDRFLPSSSPSSLPPNNGFIRRFPEDERSFGGGGDRRHNRMIKNRESAARSRARKQAYTNELESEIERLKEELARQKQQLQQSVRSSQASAAARGGRFPGICSLRRTLSAPI